MNRVILATDQNQSYDFFAPLTALMFRHVTEFEPTVLLAETEGQWTSPSARLVLSKLREVNADVQFIGRIDGYLTAQQAQSSRQHAAALPFHGNDWLMTSDVDMWPLDHAWFNQHRPDEYPVTLHYANAYGYAYHCTAYLGMRARTWREIMGIEVTGEVASQLQKSFDKHLTRYHDSWQAWNHDELYFGSRLKGWDGYPQRCQMIERFGGPPDDRIDRSGWPAAPLDFRGKVDSHLVRPGHLPENWPRLRPILERYLPSRMNWIDDYVAQYREARAKQ